LPLGLPYLPDWGLRLEKARELNWGAMGSLVWLCSMAPLAAILMPVLIPVIQATHDLSPVELGLLASADLAGACIATVTAPLWLHHLGARGGTLLGIATLIAANTLGALSPSVTALLTTRLVAGLGTGLVLSSAIPVVARSLQPARLVSAIQVMQLLLAAGALAGSGWLLSQGGASLVLLAVVGVSIFSLPFAFLLPPRSAVSAAALPTLEQLRPGAAVLVAILVYFAAVGMLTNYGGKLGLQSGLSIGMVSSALALANLGALPGSFVAMFAGSAERRRRFLIAVCIIQCLAIGVVLLVSGATAFGLGFFAIQMSIAIVAPLQVALLVDRDPSGRAIEGLAAMQSLGQAAGPLLGALFITAANVDGAYGLGVACVIVSLLLMTGGVARRPGSSPAA